MVNITHKKNTLRKAIAVAHVTFGSPKTSQAIIEQTVPKGNVLEAAKIAALFAAKNTSNAIPDCHPLPIEFTEIRFQLNDDSLKIECEIHTIYKTGVEVEAMYAASVAAITCYDMLKPIDKQIVVQEIKLLEKSGGKTSQKRLPENLEVGIVICSNKQEDDEKSSIGYLAKKKFESLGIRIGHFAKVELNSVDIEREFRFCLESKFNLIIMIGGTGISPNDITTDIINPYIEKRLLGVEESIRSYGQSRTPYAMLSRSLVGLSGESLVMVLPGSKNGMLESIDAVFPEILHSFWMLKV
ncbi:MAG: bifunctional molybdenum cofactor biosynthesis protein MoaC/MoaB [Cytophagales bacterium]